MKTADIAFAATLTAMLLASLAALASLGLRTGTPIDASTPVFRLEPVVITGTKGLMRAPRRSTSAAGTAVAPCPPAGLSA
jgi:hypothetical protein